jgi:hypothetical protein
MILYHATRPELLKPPGGTILTEGLRPGLVKQAMELPPIGVVWLSKIESTAAWSEFARAHCCIKLAVPSHDRKLAKWRTWLAQHSPEMIEMMLESGERGRLALETCFIYFGVIPPAWFRGIILSEEAMAEAQQEGSIVEDVP